MIALLAVFCTSTVWATVVIVLLRGQTAERRMLTNAALSHSSVEFAHRQRASDPDAPEPEPRRPRPQLLGLGGDPLG